MKTPQRILNNLLVITGCLLCHAATAQQAGFKYKSALAPVDSAGYYRINLQPGLMARAKSDLSDIRIVGGDKQFVAYVKTGDLPAYNKSRFVTFPHIPTKNNTDTSTVFVVQNPTDGPVSQLWLRLKNTAVERQITITGSDDQQTWFAISENMSMGTATDNDVKGVYQQNIIFPASSYRYLKLVINNSHKSPVNIMEAGIYTYLPAKPQYVIIKDLTFKQVDSPNHITHIYINFGQAYPVNKLYIPVITNTYFRREMNVYVNNASHQWLTSKTFGNEDAYINLSVRAKSLDVQIINNDDRPLPISKVEAYQSESYVVARLEAHKPYYLLFGNETAMAPKYDLQFFTEKIGTRLSQTTHLKIEPNPAFKTTEVSKPTQGYKYWLWASIAFAVAILSALTVSMTKEVKKRG